MATRDQQKPGRKGGKFPFERDKNDRVETTKKNWHSGVIVKLASDHFFVKPTNPLPRPYSNRKDVYGKTALISKYLPDIRERYKY